MVLRQGEIQPMHLGVLCIFCSLLLSSWALYFSQPLRRTRSPSRSRNSSNAGPELSLLYMSSSELCPARQYITPTFRWKFSYMRRQRGTQFIVMFNMCIYTIFSFKHCRTFRLIWFPDYPFSDVLVWNIFGVKCFTPTQQSWHHVLF